MILFTFNFLFVLNIFPKECEFTIKEGEFFSLEGEWNFFRGRLTVTADPKLDLSFWKSLYVPFKWYQVPELKNYKGEIWLRCNLIFEFLPKESYLDLGFLKEIDEVYWNGEKIGGMGNFEERIPDFSERRIYSLPVPNVMEKNTLAIRIYGTFWNAGIPTKPKIHFSSDFLQKKYRYETLAFAFSLAYVFSSLFFVFFGIFTSEKKVNLYFSAFVILLSLYYSIILGKRYDFFDNYILSYIAELFCLIPLPLLFYSFIKEWIKVEENKAFKIIFFSTMAILILAFIGYMIPYIYRTIYLHLVTYINIINIFYVLYHTLKLLIQNNEKVEYSKFLKIGLFGLVPFIINDAFIALDFINTPRMFIFSFSIFLISYGLYLSEKTLFLKKESEEKSLELRNLEKQKLNVIYNISNEFQSIFADLRQSLILNQKSESEVLRLEYLLENINTLENLENHRYSLQPSKINLKEEFHALLERILQATKQKKTRVKIKFHTDSIFFWTDSYLFKIIFYNLIENALLYSRSVVKVDIDKENETLIVLIKDEGPGIPEDIKNKIFLKYIRGNHQKVPGSGIGLTIVNEAIALLSGEIYFESKLDFFTEFKILLPPLKEIL